MNQTKDIVESLLFASDRPLSVGILQTIIKETDVRQIQEAIESLKKQYDQSGRSFQILELAGGYQICTRPQYAPWVRELFRCRAHSRLSRPALETLAIIAYEQPIVRAEIECLRGVCIDGVLNTLLARKLITIKGRKISVGRPLLYGTTDEFLRYFGLNKITDLPAKDELSSLTESPKAAEGVVTEYEGAVEQILGPARGNIQTSGGSIHPGGSSPG